MSVSSQDWWWYLDNLVTEQATTSHRWNRFDWLWRVLRVIVWTGNLAVLGTLATLFLGGSSGIIGALAVALPSLLSLLQAQSELTETGRKGFDQLLAKFRIPQHFHEEAKFVSALLITGLLLGIWIALPLIAEAYKREGKKYQENRQLALAEEKYLQAIELDPDNLDAHYKLATLYEALAEIDSAKKQYLIAARGGYIDADNNLAYWYIRQNQAAEAVDILSQGLRLVEKEEQNLEQLTLDEKKNLETQKYSLFKNLGWARFEQGRNQDALPYLLPALNIAQNYKDTLRNPGAVYCLYAQVLQESKDLFRSERFWQQCRELIEERLAAGEEINPEEDQWLHEAKQQLP